MADFSPTDFNAVVQTVAGEAANQSPQAQAAVASTILNRHALLGKPIAAIAADPAIYNGADSDNAQAAQLGTPLYKAIAANIAPVFTNGPTTSATHFHADMDHPPAWDNGTGTRIGDQVFLDRSDLLKAAAPGPSADEIEAHALPNVPGYVSDPAFKPLPGQGPTDPFGQAPAIPLGGPGADAIEKAAGFDAGPPPAPATPAQQAANRDARIFDTGVSDILHLALHGPYGGNAVNTEAPFIHGATQGFSDELAGKAFAGLTGVRNALGAYLPYGMSEADAAGTGAARERLAGIEAQHPVVSSIANVAGSALPILAGAEIAVPGRVATEAPTALGRLSQYLGRISVGGLKGTAAGSAGGALEGFGDAEGTAAERVPAAEKGAALGALFGGAVGAAVPGAAPLVGKAAHALGGEIRAGAGALRQGAVNALTGGPPETTAAEYFAAKSPAVQAVKGLVATPDVAESVEPTAHETRLAQQKVTQMMAAKGMGRDDLRALPQDIPFTTAEAIGSQTVNHAASLARRAGTTPDAAGAQMAQRTEDFPHAVMDDFADAARIDPRQARVLNEDVTGVIHRDEVTPAYQAALDVEHPKPVMTPTLAKLQQDPDVQKALSEAERLVAKTGRPVSMAGPKIDPDTGAPVLDSQTQQPVFEHQPTPEVWDQVKKILDTSIVRRNGAPVRDGPDGVKNIFLQKAASDMREALKDAIPGYDKALASASDELSRKAAYKLGDKTLFDSTPVKDMIDARAKMSPYEKEAHTAGVANAIFNKAQTGRLTPAVLKTPLFREKLRAVLGDQVEPLIERLQQRVRLQATGARMTPGAGSQTTPLVVAQQETAPVVDALGNIGKEIAHAKASPLSFIAKHSLKTALGDAVSNVAETPGFRNAYGRLLLQHPRLTADELANAPAITVRALPPVRARASALAGVTGAHLGDAQP